MSQPNIPDITPEIGVTGDQAINLLLASISMEELGLAHIINAEGEKIQLAVGTLTDDTGAVVSPALADSIEDLIAIDNSVNSTLKNVIKKEMLLQFKLENIIDLIIPPVTPTSPPPEAPTGAVQA